MTDRVQILALAISLALFFSVIDLVRRKSLTEEYSLVWLLAAGLLFVASLSRELLHAAAGWLGIAYPPALLVLAVVGVGFVGLLSVSVVLSRQRRQIERLVEEIAVMSARLDDIDYGKYQSRLRARGPGDGRGPGGSPGRES